MPNRGKLRRAAAVWRLLVHRHATDGPSSDMAYDIQSDRIPVSPDSPHSQTTVLERTEFDELVVGSWIHVEQMNTGQWWMSVGGVVLQVDVDRDGRPRSVSVFGPNDYEAPVAGCTYSLAWDGCVIQDVSYPPDRPDRPAANPTPEGAPAMTRKIAVRIAGATGAVVLLFGAGAASCEKITEPWSDAKRSGVENNQPVDIITNADGFSNVSTKCDHGNRLYVAYHGDSPYAAIAVVPGDPTCKK